MNDADFKFYGDWLFGEGANEFPVGHILGSRLLYGRDHEAHRIEVQIAPPDNSGRVAVLQFPFLEAMALLSLLKAAQLDCGFPMPDDPRG